MKKIILATALFLLGFSATSFSQLLIGKIENEKPVLTSDKQKLISSLNKNLLKAAGIAANFTSVSILTNEKKECFLVFKGANNRATFEVQNRDGNLYAEVSVTCTTSDCASEELGCIPSGTRCLPCANGGKCTKVVTERSSPLLEE
jgi:hypothetical protein